MWTRPKKGPLLCMHTLLTKSFNFMRRQLPTKYRWRHCLSEVIKYCDLQDFKNQYNLTLMNLEKQELCTKNIP